MALINADVGYLAGPAKRWQAFLPAIRPPDGLLPRITHHASRITYHFPMSKNVGSKAKPKLGKPFEPSNGGHKKNLA